MFRNGFREGQFSIANNKKDKMTVFVTNCGKNHARMSVFRQKIGLPKLQEVNFIFVQF